MYDPEGNSGPGGYNLHGGDERSVFRPSEDGEGRVHGGDTPLNIKELVFECMKDSYEWFPEWADDLPFMTLALNGEAGELANLVKKTMRGSHQYEDLQPHIAEEAMDTFIYLMNVFGILEVDVMELYNAKRRANQARFGHSASASGSGVRREVPGEDREGPGEVRPV